MRAIHRPRPGPALLCAIILAAGVPPAAPALDAAPGHVEVWHGFNVRYGVAGPGGTAAPGHGAMAALADKAESFAVDVLTPPQVPGERRILGTGEAHGLYEVPLEAVARLLWDYPVLKTISPKLRDVKVEHRTDTSIVVYEELGISFLGIRIGYKLRLEAFRDDFPDGSVGLRYRMIESLDGKLYAADSSWYLKEIEAGGRKLLYMRTFSTSGMRNPGLGVAAAMKAFTAGELSGQVEAVARKAREPAGK